MSLLDSKNDIGRYGISALTKKRSPEAVPYEIMCDFDTGEVVIKGPDGRVISFDKNSRLKQELDSFRTRAICQNIKGDILEIIPSDILNLPYAIDENVIVLDRPIKLSDGCKKTFISIDIDTIEYTKKVETTNPATGKVTIEDSNFEFNGKDIICDINLEINGISKEFSIPLKKLNTKVFCVSKLSNTDDNVSVVLQSISFKRNPEDEKKDLKVLLYSILYICE